MNLIIDIGNTKAKIAVFNKTELVEKLVTTNEKLQKEIKELKKKDNLENCIVSSVSNYKISEIKTLKEFKNFLELDHNTKVPFKNKYKTPKTLGVDRIALASAAVTQFKDKCVLIIDLGTCITYDFINSKAEYLGGAISPGVDMRYKALNAFTANLPLLKKDNYELIGTDTNSSIHSGVLNGLVQEVDGVIHQYLAKNQTLTVVLTGGNTNFLSKKLKSTIFANPNFLLEGLNSILRYNLCE